MNFYLLEYAINAILRQKVKNLFVFFIFSALVFLLMSVFFITNSIKYELDSVVKSLPQIIVQNLKGAKHYDIDTNIVDDILSIDGVSFATPRVWGYYYFANAGVNFSVVGIDTYEKQTKQYLLHVANTKELKPGFMVVGKGVKKVLDESYYKDYFNFIKPDGTMKKVGIAGVFESAITLEANDVMVMSKDDAREIFDMPKNKATDIVVGVANPKEIQNIANKIKLEFPSARVLTQNDLKISYQNIFDYKSGFFLAIFTVSLFTFFMIVYEKLSGLSSQEKKEIGILKALGWKIEDVLKEKFYEGFIVSFFAYILGVGLAFLFVYILNAPLLRGIFEGYSQLKTPFELPFVFDLQSLSLVFLLSVPVYIAAIIIPSWRVATLEADEVMR